MDERLWQQRRDVCVNGCEPGVSTGPIFTPQHHSVLPIWRVKLQQPTQHMQKALHLQSYTHFTSMLSSDIITLSQKHLFSRSGIVRFRLM